MTNREIDKLIHTEIMGLGGIASRYTEEISLAWRVEEKIWSTKGPEISAYIVALNEITLAGNFYTGDALANYGTLWRMVHASPLHRCLAALQAGGVEVA